MNNRTICKVKNCVLWLSLSTIVIGCGEFTIREPDTREAVIERNIGSTRIIDGKEYKNSVLPFEQVTDDDIKYLADNHPNIRQIIFGYPFTGESVEYLTDEALRHLGRLQSLESIKSLAGRFVEAMTVGECSR